MKHIVIVTGGYMNTAFGTEYMKSLSYDRLFAVDKGLEYVMALGLAPDYVIGDFDTVDANVLRTFEIGEGKGRVERHPARKDETDTELAVWKAMEEDAGCITLLGATGSRLDHVFANVGLLCQTIERGIDMQIVDETNRIRILDGEYKPTVEITKRQQLGTYISLIPLTDLVEGVTLEGVVYPVQDLTIVRGSSRTVSNEIASEKMQMTIKKGQVLLIESRDTWR